MGINKVRYSIPLPYRTSHNGPYSSPCRDRRRPWRLRTNSLSRVWNHSMTSKQWNNEINQDNNTNKTTNTITNNNNRPHRYSGSCSNSTPCDISINLSRKISWKFGILTFFVICSWIISTRAIEETARSLIFRNELWNNALRALQKKSHSNIRDSPSLYPRIGLFVVIVFSNPFKKDPILDSILGYRIPLPYSPAQVRPDSYSVRGLIGRWPVHPRRVGEEGRTDEPEWKGIFIIVNFVCKNASTVYQSPN